MGEVFGLGSFFVVLLDFLEAEKVVEKTGPFFAFPAVALNLGFLLPDLEQAYFERKES